MSDEQTRDQEMNDLVEGAAATVDLVLNGRATGKKIGWIVMALDQPDEKNGTLHYFSTIEPELAAKIMLSRAGGLYTALGKDAEDARKAAAEPEDEKVELPIGQKYPASPEQLHDEAEGRGD